VSSAEAIVTASAVIGARSRRMVSLLEESVGAGHVVRQQELRAGAPPVDGT
jgi:hypothetical protein